MTWWDWAAYILALGILAWFASNWWAVYIRNDHPSVMRVTCERCLGTGCSHCDGLGWYVKARPKKDR